MLTKLVTVFACLWLLTGRGEDVTDVQAGYLAADPERGDTLWAVAKWLGLTMPGETPWFRTVRPNAADYIWAFRTELKSLRNRVRH